MAPDADAPGPVRPGEELDPVRLGEYLRRTLGLDGPLHVEQFPGGHSNLTYLVTAGGAKAIAFGPTRLAGSDTRRQLVARYAERSGRAVHDIGFYYCFGLFKTAVVAQQIYYRFRQGLTRDPRFAVLGGAVRVLARQAAHHLGRPEL